ncbi:hypothetical protein ANPL_02700 [Anaplasma platys]|uniref:Uncharacterized protein n=1 Tax=Anaplasma platys TaxID=949 RepID=A0A858PYF7_9RICK|nr:hypothetical protein [Anaplasma platys]QJC27602.1 hypothetical protein ANPL_02700 [Anaplasma platys]
MLFIAEQADDNEKECLLKHTVLVAALSGVLSDNQSPQHRMAIEDILTAEVKSARGVVNEMYVRKGLLIEDGVFSSVVNKELVHYIFADALAILDPTQYTAPHCVRISYAFKAELMLTVSATKAIAELLETTPILAVTVPRKNSLPMYKKNVASMVKRLVALAAALSRTPNVPGTEAKKEIQKTAKGIYKSAMAFAKKTSKNVYAQKELIESARLAEVESRSFYHFATLYSAKYTTDAAYSTTRTYLTRSISGAKSSGIEACAELQHEGIVNAGGCSTDITRVHATHSYVDRVMFNKHNLSPDRIGEILLSVAAELKKVCGAYERAIDAVSAVSVAESKKGNPRSLENDLLEAITALLTMQEEVRHLCVRGNTDLLGACIVELGKCVKAVQVPVRNGREREVCHTPEVSVINTLYGDTMNAIAHALIAFSNSCEIGSSWKEHASLEETAVMVSAVADLLDSAYNAFQRDELAAHILKRVKHAREAIAGGNLSVPVGQSAYNNDRTLVTLMCDFVLAVLGSEKHKLSLVHYSDFVRFNLLHVKYLTGSVREALLSVDGNLQDILKQHVVDVLDVLCSLETELNKATPLTDARLQDVQDTARRTAEHLHVVEQGLASCSNAPKILSYYVQRALAACKACNNVPIAVSADPETIDNTGSVLRKLLVSKNVVTRALPNLSSSHANSAGTAGLLLYSDAVEMLSAEETAYGACTQVLDRSDNKVGHGKPGQHSQGHNESPSSRIDLTSSLHKTQHSITLR